MAGYNNGNWAEALEPDIREWFDDEYNTEQQLMIGRTFTRTINSTIDEEKFQESNHSVDWSNFDENGQIIYTSGVQGNSKTLKPVQYTAGFYVEKTLVEDMLFNVIESAARAQAIGAARKVEETIADVFNNGFSTETVADNLSLMNGAHSSLQSGVATQSNSGTSALTEGSLRATRILMKKFKTPGGKKMLVRPDTLLVPIDLGDTAEIITQTVQKVDSANNDVNNSFRQNYKVIEWDFLTDTNNWFLIDSRFMNLFFLFIDRIPMEKFSMTAFETFQAKFAARMRFEVGAFDWRWIYGHKVA